MGEVTGRRERPIDPRRMLRELHTIRIARWIICITALGPLMDSGLLMAQANAGETTVVSDPIADFYVHAGGGLGAGLGFSEVTDLLLNGDFAIGISDEKSVLARVGFRRLVQLEFRLVDAAYLFRNFDIVNNETTEIPMDFDSREWMVKLNPISAMMSGQRAFFAFAGAGTADWFDEGGDGFDGTSFIIGVEGAVIADDASVHFGLARRALDYEVLRFGGVSVPTRVSMSTYTISLSAGVGLSW